MTILLLLVLGASPVNQTLGEPVRALSTAAQRQTSSTARYQAPDVESEPPDPDDKLRSPIPSRRIQSQLPSSVPGLYGYGSRARKFGLQSTINALKEIGRRWQRDHPNAPPIGIGDISKQGGGRISGHASHRRGIDIDLDVIGTDRRPRRPPTITRWHRYYSRTRTLELIKVIVEVRRPRRIYFNDPAAHRLYPGLIRTWPNHNGHLHVRY